MNLSQLVLTIVLIAAATTSGDAAKKQVNVLKRDNNKNRKLRNQKKVRKLHRAMSIEPIVTPSPVSTDEPVTPSPVSTDEPTPEPTPSPTSNECDDIGDVKESRSGVQYDLRYNGDSSCRDASGQRYEYGEIDSVDGIDDCAETCVQDVPSAVLSHFRGIDFVCATGKGDQGMKEQYSCRCLYDAGTLESNSRAVDSASVFDSTNTDGTGKGAVDGDDERAVEFGTSKKFNRVRSTVDTEEDKEVACVKLESTKYVDVAVA